MAVGKMYVGLFQKAYRAADEVAQGLTTEQTVAKQSQVDQLLYQRLAGSVLTHNLLLRLASFGDALFKVVDFLLSLSIRLFVIAGCVAQGCDFAV